MISRRYCSVPWLVLLGVAMGGFLAVYLRALPYPPVFDDFAHVIENRAIRYLFHPRIFFESEHTRARPLPYITFALSYQLWGLSLSGLRGLSVALHAANALLVGLFFQKRLAREPEGGSAPWGALAAGTLFLLHPLAADSVIYLSARGSLLVLFFVLAALLFHARDRQGAGSWLGYLACAALAFLSRESAAALAPLVLAAHRLSGRRATELAPYFVPLVLGGLVALSLKAQYLGAAWRGYFAIEGDVDVRAFSDYLRLSLSLWPRILGFLAFPSLLAIDHQVSMPAGWGDPAVLGGIAIWISFGGALYGFFRTRSRAAFPLCWLALSLLPTNSVFPLLDPLSERHIYFALPAIAWLFGLGVEALTRAWPRRGGGALAGLLVLGVALAGEAVTLPRVLDWSSAAGLWLSAHRQAPGKFRIAFNAASNLVTERGDRRGAVSVLAETLARLPPGAVRYEDQGEAAQLLANVLGALAADTGQEPRELARELGFREGFWAELVFLRIALGREPFPAWDRAWEAGLARARGVALSPRAQDPRWVENTFTLLRGEALQAAGREREALAAYEKVILSFRDVHFPYWTAREPLADLYLKAGREEEAVKQYELAAYQYKVFKRFPLELHQKLYTIFRNRGDLHRASDAVGELVRVRTDDPELRRLYADLLRQRLDKHAMRQAGEADYYTRNAVSPTDDRELLRP